MSLYRLLQQRHNENTPIRVGVVGAGQMGRGLIAQLAHVPGMRLLGVCDIRVEAAQEAVEYYRHQFAGAGCSIKVSADFRDVLELPEIDVVVDATGVPEAGAQLALNALMAKKHLVSLNVEVDVTVGPILSELFKAAGLIYTGSAGDEPAATLELVEFAESMGLQVVVAGKGKNNPYIPSANPDTCAEEAARKRMSPRMLAAFQDGTKTMAEMNLLSNATGFVPDVPGMHGVHASLDDVLSKLRLVEEGGCLTRYSVVEYVHGLAPGVFVIVKSPTERMDEELRYLSIGDGPYYILYRPYHLASLETPISIARAVLRHDPTIAALGGPVSETVAVAKRDIRSGERIDGIGGYSVRGIVETHEICVAERHVPVGCITGETTAKRDIRAGAFLTYDDVELDATTSIWHLRQLQNRRFS